MLGLGVECDPGHLDLIIIGTEASAGSGRILERLRKNFKVKRNIQTMTYDRFFRMEFDSGNGGQIIRGWKSIFRRANEIAAEKNGEGLTIRYDSFVRCAKKKHSKLKIMKEDWIVTVYEEDLSRWVNGYLMNKHDKRYSSKS